MMNCYVLYLIWTESGLHRLSRPCYDKPWRCPGWSGGGPNKAKKYKCEDGRIQGWSGDKKYPHLYFHRCNECNVITIPFVLRWLSIHHLFYTARH